MSDSAVEIVSFAHIGVPLLSRLEPINEPIKLCKSVVLAAEYEKTLQACE